MPASRFDAPNTGVTRPPGPYPRTPWPPPAAHASVMLLGAFRGAQAGHRRGGPTCNRLQPEADARVSLGGQCDRAPATPWLDERPGRLHRPCTAPRHLQTYQHAHSTHCTHTPCTVANATTSGKRCSATALLSLAALLLVLRAAPAAADGGDISKGFWMGECYEWQRQASGIG